MSKRTLARRLSARDTSVSAEINAMRRELSAHLLADTTKAVGAIALDVGYSDPAVFCRAFKRWTGLTPTAYRKRFRPPG